MKQLAQVISQNLQGILVISFAFFIFHVDDTRSCELFSAGISFYQLFENEFKHFSVELIKVIDN